MTFQDNERPILDRAYRAAKRAERMQLYADPVHGARMRRFCETLNHFGPEDADGMCSYVSNQACRWLRAAPYEIRCAALSQINSRIQAIRIRAGLPVFDDPVGDEPDDVFLICKRVIGL